MKRSTLFVLLLLGLSLSTNLFIAGMYVGGEFYKEKPAKKRYVRRHKKAPDITMRTLVSRLPEEKKQLVTPYLQDRKKVIRDTINERRKVKRDIYKLLYQDPVDMDALATAVKKDKVLSHKIDMISAEGFLEIIPHLSLEERQQLLKTHGRRKKRKHDH